MNAASEHLILGDTKMVKTDYFAVYVKRSPKSQANFLVNVQSKSASDALRIARDHGHKIPRGSYAVRIGKEGYFSALRRAFGQYS